MRDGATFGDARERCLASLEERERRFAYALAAGVLRRQAALDHALALARTDRRLHDVLRLGAYQLRHTRVPAHAAVSTSVDLARQAAGEGGARFVNRALRTLARDGGAGAQGEVASHPSWLVARWRRRFGADDTERLLAWNDARPSLTIQPARWDMAALRVRFTDARIAVDDAPFGAGLRIVAGRPGSATRPTLLPGYAEGGFIVQDGAHALVCRFAAIPPGQLVYDACAAPGGKAVTLERLGARVIAGEVRPHRAARLAASARRAGVAPRFVQADLLSAPFAERSLDAVLVDAPCTATGTMGRHPDARWRLRRRAPEWAAIRQTALLSAAAVLVRPGGLLVYATCSLEPEENEEVVNAFLDRYSAFRREPEPGSVPDELLTPVGDFCTFPPRHAIDGAFAARLRRAG